MGWQDRVLFEYNTTSDYVAFIDESGTASFKDKDKHLTITATVFKLDKYINFRDSAVLLKEKYWKNGMMDGHRVVFHSEDIAKKRGAFNLAKYDDFTNDLANLISNADFTIFSSTLDKSLFKKKYPNPYENYSICCEFIIERIVRFFLKNENETVTLYFEARGKKEDNLLHEKLINIYKYGTYYVERNYMKKITGIYFANKLVDNGLKSYPGIELADLCAHDMRLFTVSRKETRSFKLIKNKIYKFPRPGCGFKLFP